jgi:very-short-patch-repair endonuclease
MKVDWDGLELAIRSMTSGLADLMDSALVVSRTLALPVPKSLQEAARLEQLGRHLLSAPSLDKQAMADAVWDKDPAAIKDLVAAVRTWTDASEGLASQVSPAAWTTDLTESRRWIAEYGSSLLRLLNGPYRRSIALLRSLVSGPLAKTATEQLALIDKIMAGQKAHAAIQKGDSLGKAAFGTIWRQDKTQASSVEAIFNWVTKLRQIGAGGPLPDGLMHVQDAGNLAQQVEALSGRLATATERATKVFEAFQIDCMAGFCAKDLQAVSIDGLVQRSTEWLQQPEALSRWSRYYQASRQARQWGMADFVDRLDMGEIPASALLECMDRVVLSQWLREAIKQRPSLGQFDGLLHDRQIAEFRQLDKQRLTLAKVRVLDSHVKRMPPADSGIGAAGIIAGEIQRKRGHRPIRRLLKDAGTVVQAIKPVFMMSPLSVAQFLEPGAVEFDLMVMDEASQVQPVDALGAIVRCKQIVVVGDSKQLPPTRFFTKLTSNVEDSDPVEDEPQAAAAQDIESILGLCCARGLSQSMLRWHYRSRHHSLIAVSNHEFYEDRLFIIPSPYWTSDVLGVKFHAVANSTYDSGGSRANRVEAAQVCQAIMEHARRYPGLSLGVATFSIQQQQEILDQLERLRRDNPDTEAFFTGHEDEPFFVKNLENVQGDERDVIFISVGYGRDSKGVVAMRFGPLSQDGGERRLNVLISRAKQRCEVFTSITADDIDLERASGRGVAALKTFLHYAQTGQLDMTRSQSSREPSAFELVVRRSIESLGFQVDSQVGLAGLFLDLAVVHPQDRSRYVLGVECDGPEYRASRSARDRDRLSQAVLEGQGWVLHRIWSEDWFQRPAEQLQKVKQAIDKALTAAPKLAAPAAPAPAVPAKPAPAAEQTIQRQSRPSVDDHSLSSLAVPYKEAKVKVPKRQDPGDVSQEDMAQIVRQVVDQEGPIHPDEVVARVRSLWGLARTTPRLQQAVTAALELLVITRFLVRDEGFVMTSGAGVQIRNREQAPASTRKPESLPPAEVRAAITALVSACHGAAREEIPTAVSRLLGFKSTTTSLRELVDGQITRLVQDGSLQDANGLLKTPA